MTYVQDPMNTFAELARDRALRQPQQRAYTFLEFRPEPSESHLTYAQLDLQARAIAIQLHSAASKGDRALLLYRSGLDFICGFFGCLYAGIIAVPVTVAGYRRGADRLRRILKDADTSVILSTTAVKRTLENILEGESLNWICSDELTGMDVTHWNAPIVEPRDLALLQYSSGSTGHPKGIMISHANLIHQSRVIHESSRAKRDSCSVSWLPHFHDMGLIAGVLQPFYGGYLGVIMSPETFGESPYRWLKAISDHWADISAAPNFAYEMCLQRISPEQRRTLDLSRWRVAINAAEPVRAKIINDFAETFGSCGFHRDAFHPSYGLAEATLMVTGGSNAIGPSQRSFDTDALAQNQVVPVGLGDRSGRVLVGCGVPISSQTLVIVNHETCCVAGPSEAGEIWISGPSVGGGYWNRGDDTLETFRAHLASGEGPYLRTGDLGFVHDGELFICGRLKDLILVRGRNHHAPDIELTVEGCHAALRTGSGAAFSVEIGEEERVIVAQELNRHFKSSAPGALAEILIAIRQAVAENHEIQVHSVVLLRHGTIPKTSSGKIQRRECRHRYLQGSLNVQATWVVPTVSDHVTPAELPVPSSEPAESSAKRRDDVQEIEWWLAGEVARRAKCDPASVDTHRSFKDMGLSSEHMLELIRATESQFECMLPMTLLTEFPSINDLTRYLLLAGIKMRANEEDSRPTQASSIEQQLATSVGTEPIAIIGIGCRFPGAQGPREFWKMLCDGIDAITEVPPDRWDIDEVYDPNPLAIGKLNTRCGGFLKNVDQMDRNFFGISVREAVRMDPQHRLTLEVAWEALEDAGLVPKELSGQPTGVFVGISCSDYAQMQFGDAKMADAYAGLGCALTIAASRISHFLNLRGPAIAVDTACSSSLTAVHLACSSIRQGECTLALAGGVNVLLSPITTMCLTKAGMMAPDGRCKAFDARANGYVRSEGAGMVVLKLLSRAVADGDPIYAVIRGTASNQDGRSSGLAAPNGEAQESVILAACRDAGISPGEFDYVEAHGTGTAVGDPIEVKALGNMLSIDRPSGSICAIGSVKTNIGHTESAAGVASLIKTALVLKHRLIPPSLHFEQPNPLIPFESLPLRVQTTLGPLPERSRPILAGVNGFGVGGTNVHIVLEEAPRTGRAHESVDLAAPARSYVMPLSAGSPASLRTGAQAMAEALRQPDAAETLFDMCYTASVRRGHLEHRMTVTGNTATEMSEALACYVEQGHHPAVVSGFVPAHLMSTPKLGFVFSGQGSQWWGMGRGLLKSEPVFRHIIEECDALLQPFTGWSLIKELAAQESNSRLDETAIAQPALFALQTALTALWRSWGVVPDVVVGHSVGEVAAAHTAGVLALPDAIRLIAHRGRLMQQGTGLGRMASIELSRKELEPMLTDWKDLLSIAAVNGPNSVVLSGESKVLASALETLKARGIVTVPLPVNYAFHSPQMEPFKEQLMSLLQGLEHFPSQIPMFSTVTGEWCNGQPLDASYWGANVRQPVLLAAAIEGLAKHGVQIFMEIGPHPVISGAISRNLKSLGATGIVISCLRREEDEQKALLAAFGALYTQGRAGNWKAIYPHGRVCQSLPSYQWDRQRFWLDAKKTPVRRANAHPLLGARLPIAQPVWQNKLDATSLPFLKDLRVKTRVMFPGGLFTELALAAVSEAFDPTLRDLVDVNLHGSAELPEGDLSPVIQVTASPEIDGESVIRVFAQTNDLQAETTDWQLHLTARTATRISERVPPTKPFLLQKLQEECREEVDPIHFYHKLEEGGIHCGDSMRVAEKIWRGEGLALLKIRLPEPLASEIGSYQIHPVVLETATLACRIAYGLQGGLLDLTGFRRVRVLRPCDQRFYVYVRLRTRLEAGEELARSDVWIADESGKALALLQGVQFKARHDESQLGVPTEPEEWLYDIAWQPLPRASSSSGASRAKGSWLIFTDQAGVGDLLAEQLTIQEERCVKVRHGEEFRQLTAESFVVCPSKAEDMRRLLKEALPAQQPAWRGVVHLWSMDSAPAGTISAKSIDQDQTLSVISIVYLLQAVASAEFHRPPRLWTVTRGTQESPEDTSPIAISQSTVWGLGKVIAIEHPELRCCRVDLSPSSAPEELWSLFEECWSNDKEDQIMLRGEQRYVARLVRHILESPATSTQAAENSSAELSIPRDAPFRIDLSKPNLPENVVVSQISRHVPRAGEVELRVTAAGLDLKEVTRSEDTWDVDLHAACVTAECSGTIVRIGPGVTDLSVGEKVIALISGCITSYLVVKASSVVRYPDRLSSEEAATTSRALVVALHGLRDLAKLSKGELVLINGAGSCLGLAAVQVAKWLGATVFATARTEQERELLSNMGVLNLFEEYSPLFPSDLQNLTDGKGVDVVLNCVSGWNIAECLPVLSAFGRCIDAARSQSGRRANTTHFQFTDNVSFHTVDIDQLQSRRPEYVRYLLGEVMSHLDDSVFSPLPVRIFPAHQMRDALVDVKAAEQPGRVAISLPQSVEAPNEEPRTLYRDDSTYLITGGLGGLGLGVAQRMVQGGARSLALVGRSAPSAAAQEALAHLREQGVNVLVASIDVAEERQVRALLSTIRETMPPLRGVIHAAGMLGNSLLVHFDEARFRSVMPAKITGAWNLHITTAGLPLDFFVLFSSLASLIGSHGQANYAAANAFLDGLAIYRRALGMPALSIGWGPWSEIGMASDVHNQARLKDLGMGMLAPSKALDILGRLILEKSGSIGAIAMNWQLWSKAFPVAAESPFVSSLMPERQESGSQRSGMLTALRLEELNPDSRIEQLESSIHKAVCQSLRLDPAILRKDMSLSAVGLDSIVALELKSRIESCIDVVVHTPNLLKGPTIHQLAVQFLAQMLAPTPESPNGKAAAAAPEIPIGKEADASEAERLLGELNELSDEEVTTLLSSMARKEA